MATKPFFTVVTEVYNRQSSIVKTIMSVINQEFIDYEYIIIDSKSTDNSTSLIKETLSKYKRKNIFFYEYPFEENEITRWNRPLKHASGSYIVGLEGDDWFDTGYLKQAYKILQQKKYGIYVGIRNGAVLDRKVSGHIVNYKALKSFKKLAFCPPPSEVIFLRNHKNKYYLYDEDFIWAAEYSLYEQILLDGYDVFIENRCINNYIHRGVSYRRFGYKHVHDALIIFNKYVNSMGQKDKSELIDNILNKFSILISSQIYQFNFEVKLFKKYCELLIKYRRFVSLNNLFYRIIFVLPRNLLRSFL